MGILELFVSKYPQLTLDPKEQTVFLMGAVFFLGEDAWIVCCSKRLVVK